MVDDFAVWPENWPAALAWIALSTQWRTHRPPMGDELSYEGLRFDSLPVALDMAGVTGRKKRQRVLTELALMEREALPILNGVDDTDEETE